MNQAGRDCLSRKYVFMIYNSQNSFRSISYEEGAEKSVFFAAKFGKTVPLFYRVLP